MTETAGFFGDAAAAGEHYNRIVEAERARLEQFSPVEFALTKRYFARHIPEGSRVAEIGVGVGHYSEFLARRNCRLELIDVSTRLLEAARGRLDGAGLGGQISGLHNASATNLPLPDRSVDAVLLMGPLYHLRDLNERRKAVEEVWRVLRPRGIVAAAGINRICYLRDMFRSPDAFSVKFFSSEFEDAQRVSLGAFVKQYLVSGTLDPEHAPPLGYAHLTTIAEFQTLLTERFEELVLTGAEAFTSCWQDEWKSKTPEEAEGWLDVIEASGKTVEGMAYSDHFLFIGRRK